MSPAIKPPIEGPRGRNVDRYPPVVDQADQQFGRYTLMYQLSQGGMGTVFLGTFRDGAGLSRPVAIKRIHPHLARNRELFEMFLDEANIASRIDHPNVCKLIDFGQVDGVLYIAMEYLAGVPMHQLGEAISTRDEILRSSRWHSVAAKIAAEAALGLHAAHELTDEKGENLGTVHRDVSPQNVFVTFDGAVKLLDFGIVFARNRFHQTQNLTLKGKISYMAPEQLRRLELDRRADIWSLGVCLWEMLACRSLNTEQDLMKSLDKLLDQQRSIPLLSEIYREIPRELEQIVARALSWERENRYATANELSEALASFVMSSGQPMGSQELSTLLIELFSEEHEQKIGIVNTVITAAKTVEIVRGPIPTTAPDEQPKVEKQGEKQLIQEDFIGTIAHGNSRVLDRVPPWKILEVPSNEANDSEGTIPRIMSSTEASANTERTSPWSRFLLFSLLGLALFALGSITTILFLREGPPDQESYRASENELLSGFRSPTIEPQGAKIQRDAMVEAFESYDGGGVESGADGEGDDSGVALNQSDADRSEVHLHDAGAVPQRHRARASTRVKTKQAPRFGQVNVVTVGGWAKVSESGRPLGLTPIRLRLREGRHVLTLHPFGRAPMKQVVVNIEADKAVRVVVPVGQ